MHSKSAVDRMGEINRHREAFLTEDPAYLDRMTLPKQEPPAITKSAALKMSKLEEKKASSKTETEKKTNRQEAEKVLKTPVQRTEMKQWIDNYLRGAKEGTTRAAAEAVFLGAHGGWSDKQD